MYRLLIISCFLLAGCGGPIGSGPPVVITVVAGGDVLPVEAQRIIDASTATAAAGATHQAGATSTRVRELEQVQATRDYAEIHAQQTAVVVDATDAAALRTQAAGEAAAVHTQAAVISATQWAAAGQLIALDLTAQAAEAASAATQSAADSQKAAVSIETAIALGQVLVGAAGLAALILVVMAVYYAWRRHEIKLSFTYDVQEQRAEQERARTQAAWAEAVRASTIDHDGRPHLITPKGYVALLPAPIAATPQPNHAHAWRWRAACQRAVLAGIEIGLANGTAPAFGERDLAGVQDPVIVDAAGKGSSAGYRAIRAVLVASGVWLTISRKDTVFAPDWTPERFEREFETTPLLGLPAGEPPIVRIPHRSSAASAVPAAPQGAP